ncbi:MAG: thiamine phosphate synthase [Chloroflexi bacterium]|nr:thiamine phosphate synthase [Chloroflexota bacterium]
MSLPDAVDAAIRGGVNLVQLREKQMAAGELLVLAREIRKICRSRGALFYVNDRLDVALACDADGVQLGERSLPVDAVRSVAGTRLLIGRSVHSVEGAVAAGDADLLVLGTIYPSASHPGEPASGTGLIREVTHATSVPVVAIGGITPANAGAVMEAGASGVAVVGVILGSKDPLKAAADMRRAIARR